jgi:mannose-6-phosphate isomerase
MSEITELKAQLKRWLFDQALPLWWRIGADHVRGGFHEVIGQDGVAVDRDRRARVQARQVYVYATAGALGWDGPWRDAVEHGLSYFLTRYRRPDGLFRTRVKADGAVADDTAVLYDQAFALFALALAYRVLPERGELVVEAQDLLGQIQASFALPNGGFFESSPERPYQSNPHMHLFEAMLAWREVDADPDRQRVWNAQADAIGELCLTRFIDAESGALREFFDADWAPAPGLDGRIVEPGHQLEWAWLLIRWARLRDRADALVAATRLFEIGVGPGLDRGRGVAVQQLLDDFSVHDPVARLWPQTEWLKAALALAAATPSRPELADQVRQAGAALRLYLDTPVAGLWWDRLEPSGRFIDEPAPASSLYHIACAIAELQAA